MSLYTVYLTPYVNVMLIAGFRQLSNITLNSYLHHSLLHCESRKLHRFIFAITPCQMFH